MKFSCSLHTFQKYTCTVQYCVKVLRLYILLPRSQTFLQFFKVVLSNCSPGFPNFVYWLLFHSFSVGTRSGLKMSVPVNNSSVKHKRWTSLRCILRRCHEAILNERKQITLSARLMKRWIQIWLLWLKSSVYIEKVKRMGPAMVLDCIRASGVGNLVKMYGILNSEKWNRFSSEI